MGTTDRFDVKLYGALRVVVLQDGDLRHVARDPDAGLRRVIPFCPRQLHCSQVDEERLGCLRNVVLKPSAKNLMDTRFMQMKLLQVMGCFMLRLHLHYEYLSLIHI